MKPYVIPLLSTIVLLATSNGSLHAGHDRLKEAVQILLQTPSGTTLIQKAMGFWGSSTPQALTTHIRWSDTSRTDAVLTRHLEPTSGKEKRDREVTVYLKQTSSSEELALDLAHELVHATSRPEWDPYDPTLTAGKYIQTSIEGEGGEIQAVLTECEISREHPSLKSLFSKRCKHYLSPSGSQLEIARIKMEFYQVGRWNQELRQNLGAEITRLPSLSAQNPGLYSSTGHSPYPVALLQEYQELTQIACDNTRRRAEAFETKNRKAGRTPASSSAAAPIAERQAENFLNQRCRPRTF